MEQNERPCYTTQIGNTTIKIRSALPFMTDEQQAQWFRDNDSLPEVQMLKRAWVRATWYNHKRRIIRAEYELNKGKLESTV